MCADATEDASVLRAAGRRAGHGARGGRLSLEGFRAAACHFLQETKTDHHKKTEFFNIYFFSQRQNHIAVLIWISGRSKILLFWSCKNLITQTHRTDIEQTESHEFIRWLF